jgi:hypothetical protein
MIVIRRLPCLHVLALTWLTVSCEGPPPAPPVRSPPTDVGSSTRAEPVADAEPPLPRGSPPAADLATTSPPVRRPGAYANVDPSDDDVPGPPDALTDCDEQLTRAGVTFRHASLPVHKERKLFCGAPQVVVYVRGPGNVAYAPSPLLTCPMALALASFERIVQEEATRALGSPVVRVDQLGTYSCREMAAYPGWVSEHAYANAIDLARFTLANGTAIGVLHDFDRGPGAPSRPGGSFLRMVSQRAYDEDVFSHVLTPFFDAHHKDHFHLDLARYRGDGTRPDGA